MISSTSAAEGGGEERDSCRTSPPIASTSPSNGSVTSSTRVSPPVIGLTVSS
jgi:hypothetical protein